MTLSEMYAAVREAAEINLDAYQFEGGLFLMDDWVPTPICINETALCEHVFYACYEQVCIEGINETVLIIRKL